LKREKSFKFFRCKAEEIIKTYEVFLYRGMHYIPNPVGKKVVEIATA
jgi:hypothetical protein